MAKCMSPLLQTNSESRLFPSATSHVNPNHLSYFEFLGRLLGKAVYEVHTTAAGHHPALSHVFCHMSLQLVTTQLCHVYSVTCHCSWSPPSSVTCILSHVTAAGHHPALSHVFCHIHITVTGTHMTIVHEICILYVLVLYAYARTSP